MTLTRWTNIYSNISSFDHKVPALVTYSQRGYVNTTYPSTQPHHTHSSGHFHTAPADLSHFEEGGSGEQAVAAGLVLRPNPLQLQLLGELGRHAATGQSDYTAQPADTDTGHTPAVTQATRPDERTQRRDSRSSHGLLLIRRPQWSTLFYGSHYVK